MRFRDHQELLAVGLRDVRASLCDPVRRAARMLWSPGWNYPSPTVCRNTEHNLLD